MTSAGEWTRALLWRAVALTAALAGVVWVVTGVGQPALAATVPVAAPWTSAALPATGGLTGQTTYADLSCAPDTVTFCVAVGSNIPEPSGGDFNVADPDLQIPDLSQAVLDVFSNGVWTATVAPVPSSLLPPDIYGGGTVPAQSVISSALTSVSCPASNFCLATGELTGVSTVTDAVGKSDGQLDEYPFADVYNGSEWSSSPYTFDPLAGAPAPLSNATKVNIGAVACVSAGNCTAIGEEHLACSVLSPSLKDQFAALEYQMSGGVWQTGVGDNQPSPLSLNGISSCATTTSSPLVQDLQQMDLTGLSCPVLGECVATGSVTSADPNTLGQIVPRAVVETLSGGVWTPTSAQPRYSTKSELNGVDCPTTTSCTAVGDFDGNTPYATEWNPLGTTSWDPLSGSALITQTPSNGMPTGQSGTLSSVVCLTTTSCIAAGQDVCLTGSGCSVGGLFGNQSSAVTIPAYSSSQLVETFTVRGWDPAKIGTAGLPSSQDESISSLSCSGSDYCLAAGTYLGETPDGTDHAPTSTLESLYSYVQLQPVTQFEVTAPSTANVGHPFYFSISATDGNGYFSQPYGGRFTVSSPTDPTAQFCTSIACTTSYSPLTVGADGGWSWAYYASFDKPGPQTIEVTDSSGQSQTGISSAITVYYSTIGLDVSDGPTSVALSWTFAPPPHSASSAQWSFKVFRSSSPSPAPVTLSPIGTTTGLSYTDTAAAPGVDYYYQVEAVQTTDTGDTPGPQSRVIEGTVRGGTLSAGARIADLPNGNGYWLIDPDGGVYAFGAAPTFPTRALPEGSGPAIAIASTPDGGGYYLLTSTGSVLAFGDAHGLGSMAIPAGARAAGIAVTPDGKGYWIVDSAGLVRNFGDAARLGSYGPGAPAYPVVGLAITPDAKGYWLYTQNGVVDAIGDAHSYGSVPTPSGGRLQQPVVALDPTSDGGGYWLIGNDGSVFSFGDAAYDGGENHSIIVWPVVGIMVQPNAQGYALVGADGSRSGFHAK